MREARKYFGGGGDDWKMIGEKVVETKEGVKRVEGIQPYMKGYWDPGATLKPLTPGEQIARVQEGQGYKDPNEMSLDELVRSQKESGLPDDYVDPDGGDFSDTTLTAGGNTPISRAATNAESELMIWVSSPQS